MNKIFDNQNLKKNLTEFLSSLINSSQKSSYNQNNLNKLINNDNCDESFPELLIIQIGDNLASNKYANLKVKIGQKIGIKVNYHQYKMNGEIWQNGQKIEEIWDNSQNEEKLPKNSQNEEKTETLNPKKIELIKNHIKNLLKKNVPQSLQDIENCLESEQTKKEKKDSKSVAPKSSNKISKKASRNGLIFQLPLPFEFVDLLEIDWNNFIDVDFLASNCNLWDQNLLPPTIQAIDLVLKSLIWQKNLEHFEPEKIILTKYSQNRILKNEMNSELKNELILTKNLLQQKLDLTGKIVTVIGQGKLVGNPLLTYLQKRNATIISLNKDSTNGQKLVKLADIVICASGVPNLVKSNWFKKNTIVIDAATSESNGVLVGDLDYLEIAQNELNSQNVEQTEKLLRQNHLNINLNSQEIKTETREQQNKSNLVKNFQEKNNNSEFFKKQNKKSLNLWICPSPGGIGPLTVLCIFWNLVAIKNTNKIQINKADLN